MENNSIKALICDNSAETGIKIASALHDLGIFAYTRKGESSIILNSILSDMPDVVISDLSLIDTDAVCIMQKAQSLLTQCPQFIILSEIDNSFVERQVIESGASVFLPKTVSPEELYKAIKSVVIKLNLTYCNDAELMVTDIIRSLGMPAHIKGYAYIRTAVLECLDSQMCLESITKVLYPRVAHKHHTTPSRVERAIRHAIEIAWSRGDKDAIDSFFGYSVDICKIRPTNSEFIALAADKIRLQLKKNDYRKDIVFTELQNTINLPDSRRLAE